MTVDLERIEHAHERIRDHIHHTPIMRSDLIDSLCGADVFFKCEHLQKAGAFKSRGAVNAVMSIDERALGAGVATHSSGNHGAALARAARIRGVPAYIVMPTNASRVKFDAVRTYGGNITQCEPTLEARQSALESLVRKTGATFVPPYDDERVIAGQGTALLEAVMQGECFDCCVVPVGGGGLLAGTAIVAAANGIEVYGAEPEGADDTYRSFRSGTRITSHTPNTIADGLLTTVGALNFELVRRHVSDILLASDDEIRASMRLLWTRLKQVVEPSAAVTLATILRHPQVFAGKRIIAVLTGGNVDLDQLPFVH